MSDNAKGGGKYPVLQVMLGEAFAGGVTLFVIWMTSKWVQRIFDPLMSEKKEQEAMARAVMDRLVKAGIDPRRLEGLTSWEIRIAQELVFPEDIEGGMETLGGLELQKELLHDDVLIPLERPELFDANPLLTPPRGILMYGPPGTGKTSLAKALAKQRGIKFMCISPSSLLSKWVGDTQQLTRAIFSLAARIEPCLIFLDEIDALFSDRDMGDHEVYRDMKAEFMQLWDGLFTTNACRIIVIGCTNRPWDVDPAIQRRLPRSIKVDLPNADERAKILKTILSGTNVAKDFDYLRIGNETENYSGSDLKEVCRCALMGPMKEKIQEGRQPRDRATSVKDHTLRPLTTNDVLNALQNVSPTTQRSNKYREQVLERSRQEMRESAPLAEEDQLNRDLRNFLGAIASTAQGNQGATGFGTRQDMY